MLAASDAEAGDDVAVTAAVLAAATGTVVFKEAGTVLGTAAVPVAPPRSP